MECGQANEQKLAEERWNEDGSIKKPKCCTIGKVISLFFHQVDIASDVLFFLTVAYPTRGLEIASFVSIVAPIGITFLLMLCACCSSMYSIMVCEVCGSEALTQKHWESCL